MKERYRELKKVNRTWFLESDITADITEEQYNRITSKETIAFFRNIGGQEIVKKGYTSQGVKIIEIESISPDKTEKRIRTFSEF